jgi:hypothetical protein
LANSFILGSFTLSNPFILNLRYAYIVAKIHLKYNEQLRVFAIGQKTALRLGADRAFKKDGFFIFIKTLKVLNNLKKAYHKACGYTYKGAYKNVYRVVQTQVNAGNPYHKAVDDNGYGGNR